MDYRIDADRAWVRDLEHVLKYGDEVAPRGMLVYESLAYQSQIMMSSPIIFNERRKLGYKFMAAEAAWILSGNDDVASIKPYSRDISSFSDDGISFYGAYGPRFVDQFDYVLHNLKMDINSRQAVATIWRQNPEPSKDIPCTVALQWLVRNGAIHCVATMRSSDLWLGHPYDIFNFSCMSFAIMIELNKHLVQQGGYPLILGQLYLTAGSKHIYERNVADVKAIVDDYSLGGPKSTDFFPTRPIFVTDRYDGYKDFIDHLWECADSANGALTLQVR